MRWTIQQVARAWDAPVPAGLDPLARLAGVSIDSRTVGRCELFIAIHGPQHDGHRFIGAALEAGAAAAVVSRERLGEYPESVRAKLLGVADTLGALQDLARAVRRAWGERLAAVTGSAGKTTTKEILAALLRTKLRVLKSEGNLNNEYGLPLALLQLEPEYQAAVVELGMSHRGELRRLAEIAEPQVGVVTCVAPVHLEFFASVDEIALAKRELIEGLAPAATSKIAEESAGAAGVAVLNADDPRVARFADVAPGAVLTFGFGKRAQFRAEKIVDRGADGSTFDFISPAGRARLEFPLPGRHNIANALAALAAASVWGLGAEAAQRAFPEILAGEMRGRLLRFEPGFAVINDSYNSNPAALRAMLELLAHTAGYRRRILAAGEMLELGPASASLHRETGAAAAALNLDWIVAVQGHAAEMAAGAVDAGMLPERARFFATSAEAAAFVAEIVEPGDLLLVKGSRGVKMERVVEALHTRYTLASQVPPAAAPAAAAQAEGAPQEVSPDEVAPQSDPGRG